MGSKLTSTETHIFITQGKSEGHVVGMTGESGKYRGREKTPQLE